MHRTFLVVQWFQCRGPGFDPWLGYQVPHATQCGLKIPKKRKNHNAHQIDYWPQNVKAVGLQPTHTLLAGKRLPGTQKGARLVGPQRHCSLH